MIAPTGIKQRVDQLLLRAGPAGPGAARPGDGVAGPRAHDARDPGHQVVLALHQAGNGVPGSLRGKQMVRARGRDEIETCRACTLREFELSDCVFLLFFP